MERGQLLLYVRVVVGINCIKESASELLARMYMVLDLGHRKIEALLQGYSFIIQRVNSSSAEVLLDFVSKHLDLSRSRETVVYRYLLLHGRKLLPQHSYHLFLFDLLVHGRKGVVVLEVRYFLRQLLQLSLGRDFQVPSRCFLG